MNDRYCTRSQYANDIRRFVTSLITHCSLTWKEWTRLLSVQSNVSALPPDSEFEGNRQMLTPDIMQSFIQTVRIKLRCIFFYYHMWRWLSNEDSLLKQLEWTEVLRIGWITVRVLMCGTQSVVHESCWWWLQSTGECHIFFCVQLLPKADRTGAKWWGLRTEIYTAVWPG